MNKQQEGGRLSELSAAGKPHEHKFGTWMKKRPAPDGNAAAFSIGDIVRHRFFPFRGVIYDADPEFANTEEWWQSIPEPIRPRKNQPFYHLLAEAEDETYVAYVSQQNLEIDPSGSPVRHPAADQIFEPFAGGRYRLRREYRH